ncbi:hypothetical protein VNO77_04484 [Canavalia gladiata]|uniref:Uncharacterized protein n=1 Tax=Canavalia gladiata TaxID=3824 RepID=A0AAN9RD86_CANGL
METYHPAHHQFTINSAPYIAHSTRTHVFLILLITAMDVAPALSKPFNNTLSLCIFQPSMNPSSLSLTPSWVFTKSNILSFHSLKIRFFNHYVFSNNIPSFPHCSTKPETSTDSETENKSKGQNSLSKCPKANSDSDAGEALSNSCSTQSCSSFSRGLVFDLGPSTSWDSADIGSPVVKRFLSDEEERWFMWYYGRSNNGNPSSDMIGLAISGNGIHWERGGGSASSSCSGVGFVMKYGKDWWEFDIKGARPSELLVMCSSWVRASSSVYWLYYTGYSSDKVEFSDESCLENPYRCFIGEGGGCGSCGKVRIFKSLPGLAVSQDGRHWARVDGEHHSGALFDVGSMKEWDSLFISSPQVVWHENGDLRMYYSSFDVEKGHFAIGLARSRDGIRWVKLGKIIGGGKVGSFDEFGVMNSSVTRNRKIGNYVMAYEGVGADGRRSIGMAISPDGLKEWVRLQDDAVLKPSDKGCWDDMGVGSPCLVQMDYEWRLYYRGVGNEGRGGIGMAVSEGRDLRGFRRWTGFQV